MFVIIVMISFYICLRNINKNTSFTIQKHVQHKRKKNSSPKKIPSRYVYLNDKRLSLVNYAGYGGGDIKEKKTLYIFR